MERKLRFGLIGAGRIGNAYAQAFETAEACSLAAVADVRPEAAAALADHAACLRYSRYQDMAREAKLDAVLICTPPITHHEIGLGAVD